MESPKPEDEDVVATQILQNLARTEYACASLSSPLSTRPGNRVYRGILSRPTNTQGSGTAKSIIIKQSTDPMPRSFEELLLKSLATYPESTISETVKTPRLYLYDKETGTQVLEDFADTAGFRTTLYAADENTLLSPPSTFTIGRHLGRWLRSFHDWALAPEQAVLRAQVWQNDAMRKTKHLFTYDCILDVLGNYPELLDGCEETLEVIRDTMAKEVQRSSLQQANGYGLIHGDFWSGNILTPKTGWQEPPPPAPFNELYVIDWEFAQFGHRSCDLGQILGDLMEQKIYSNLATAISALEGVVEGYGAVDDEMAFRTAMYVGCHLVSWYNRRPRTGPRVVPADVAFDGLAIGRDFMVRAWERDEDFFRDTVLATLFTATA